MIKNPVICRIGSLETYDARKRKIGISYLPNRQFRNSSFLSSFFINSYLPNRQFRNATVPSCTPYPRYLPNRQFRKASNVVLTEWLRYLPNRQFRNARGFAAAFFPGYLPSRQFRKNYGGLIIQWGSCLPSRQFKNLEIPRIGRLSWCLPHRQFQNIASRKCWCNVVIYCTGELGCFTFVCSYILFSPSVITGPAHNFPPKIFTLLLPYSIIVIVVRALSESKTPTFT